MTKTTHPFFFSLLDHKMAAGEEGSYSRRGGGANSRTYGTQNKAAIKIHLHKRKSYNLVNF